VNHGQLFLRALRVLRGKKFSTMNQTISNDTLPVKVRDWFASGVATYIGVGKNNVA
jgi:hypothetical protein